MNSIKLAGSPRITVAINPIADYVFRAEDGPFRVVCYPNEPLYRIENAESRDGAFHLRAGASPSGRTKDEVKTSFDAYKLAAELPWIALSTDAETASGYRFEAFRPSIDWNDISPASIHDYGFTYRVGVDPVSGLANVYQCFYALGDTTQEIWDGIQGACSCGYSERDFLADLKLYLGAYNSRWLKL